MRNHFSKSKIGSSSSRFTPIVIILTLFCVATNWTWIICGSLTAHERRIWRKSIAFRILKQAHIQVSFVFDVKVGSQQHNERFLFLPFFSPIVPLGENVNKAVEMLLDMVMLRMDTVMSSALPGRMLPIGMTSENGQDENKDSIRLEHASDKSKCNC